MIHSHSCLHGIGFVFMNHQNRLLQKIQIIEYYIIVLVTYYLHVLWIMSSDSEFMIGWLIQISFHVNTALPSLLRLKLINLRRA